MWFFAGFWTAAGLPLIISDIAKIRPEEDAEYSQTVSGLAQLLLWVLLVALVLAAAAVYRKGWLPGTAPGSASEDRFWPRRRRALAWLWAVALAAGVAALGGSLAALVTTLAHVRLEGRGLLLAIAPGIALMAPAGVALSAWGTMAGKLPGTAAGDGAEDRLWPARRVAAAWAWTVGFCVTLGFLMAGAQAMATLAGVDADSAWLAVPGALVVPAVPPAAAALAIWGTVAARLPGTSPPGA
jgi:hypothetical protein